MITTEHEQTALERHLKEIEHKLSVLSAGVLLDQKQFEALTQALSALRAPASTGNMELQAAYTALRQPFTK